ncbi:helix-hairpin-helix domain-containing protein [Actinotalea sp. M2MS4P-6]|uniref:helix-hairpin-helix domain-containing protein n=1 Tax=Actinotalea sp. M2MS4P-6 TaxID=2983762 RepID=UPI0021E48675|nr:helix-hairpin-helix domain-containing protein [Actinotalea sp. M2MS4P-6]MCV2392713.1 helix-hairpin-helix domain-containing protein [Actinotalea sp. M2MS4P-6]
MARHRRGWFILLLVLIGGGAAWAWRVLRDDDAWTEVGHEPWEPVPSPEPAPEPTADAEPAPEPSPSPGPAPTEPASSASPAPAEPASADDLTRIEGIGPKIGAALVAAGLTTFAALAEADEDTLRAALSAANVRLAPSLPTWSAQARELI